MVLLCKVGYLSKSTVCYEKPTTTFMVMVAIALCLIWLR